MTGGLGYSLKLSDRDIVRSDLPDEALPDGGGVFAFGFFAIALVELGEGRYPEPLLAAHLSGLQKATRRVD